METLSDQWLIKNNDIYWTKRAKSFGNGFSEAPTTKQYFNGEKRIFRKYFFPLINKKLLKLDLWNEINNTGILFWAAEQGMNVSGLDISAYIVEKARLNFKKRGLKANLKVSDVRNIKFKSNSFDCVYTMGTIEHISDYYKALHEIRRVLKPGGIAIIGVPNKYDIFLRPLLVFFLDKLNLYPYSPEKSFTYTELKKEIETAKLKVMDRTSVLFIPSWLRILDIFFYTRCPVLVKITELLSLPFKYVEYRFRWCQKRGYLIACVAKKECKTEYIH